MFSLYFQFIRLWPIFKWKKCFYFPTIQLQERAEKENRIHLEAAFIPVHHVSYRKGESLCQQARDTFHFSVRQRLPLQSQWFYGEEGKSALMVSSGLKSKACQKDNALSSK